MNPTTIHVLMLVLSALLMGSQFAAQNFPQYADGATTLAATLSACLAALTAHAMPTSPQAAAVAAQAPAPAAQSVKEDPVLDARQALTSALATLNTPPADRPFHPAVKA